MLREFIEENEYENVQFEYLERWCNEIEINLEKGFKEKTEAEVPKNTVTKKQPISTRKLAITNKYTLSSDSDESFYGPGPSNRKMLTNESSEKEKIITISSDSSFSNNSDIIPRETIKYVTYSSDEEF